MQLSNLARPIPSFSIRILASLLDEARLDTNAMLHCAGLTPDDLRAPDLLVSGVQELAILRGFAQATAQRPDLWVAAGLRYRLFTFYPVGFAQVTSPTLAVALEMTRRFPNLHYMVGNFTAVDEDGLSGISVNYDSTLDDIADFLRVRDTIAVTLWLHDLWGGKFPFTRVESVTALPAQAGFDYGAPVTSNPQQSRWLWPTATLQLPPAHADPVLHAMYLALCEATASGANVAPLAPADVVDPLLAQVMNCIDETDRLDWTLDRMAKALHMSRRSLQRKLTERDVTFRAIVDDRRCRIAQRMLTTDDCSIAEIAWRLGYADSSSFHQAFTRWTHMSPGNFRRQRRGRLQATR